MNIHDTKNKLHNCVHCNDLISLGIFDKESENMLAFGGRDYFQLSGKTFGKADFSFKFCPMCGRKLLEAKRSR